MFKIKEIIKKIEQSKSAVDKLFYINHLQRELQILQNQLKSQVRK
jgi:hypothetical protein